MEVPGTEKVKNKEISEAAEEYVKARDRRVRASRPEIEKKESLIALMKKHKLTTYSDDELTVELTVAKEKIKVTVGSEEEED
jgi:hypothetical protein